jgi:hypothetical protein
MGIARTHAQALVFGPRSYGGIGCNDLRIEQYNLLFKSCRAVPLRLRKASESTVDAIQNLIRQLRTPGYRKQPATIFLRTFQNASGLSQPLLHYPAIRAPHLEGH